MALDYLGVFKSGDYLLGLLHFRGDEEKLAVKKYAQRFVLLITIMTLLACKDLPDVGNLVCQINVKGQQQCSSVLSLKSGVLRLDSSEQRFELKANYQACYQMDEVNISGRYQQYLYGELFNLELLATQTEANNTSDDKFPRTIGVITLDKATLSGQFVDIWATIRGHSQAIDILPKVVVECDK